MEESRSTLRLGIAEGVIPTKWVRMWKERFPEVWLDLLPREATGAEASILAGEIDAGIIRPPVRGEGLHVIQLYEEMPVVVAPKDHYVAAADEVTLADLAEEIVHEVERGVRWTVPVGTPAQSESPTTRDAVQLVAAGVGILVVPQSIARLHARKDLISRPVSDLPPTPVGLVWREGDDSELIEELIGVVRGRTIASTRGRAAEPAPKRTAAQKAAARREYLAERRGQQGRPPGRGKRRKR